MIVSEISNARTVKQEFLNRVENEQKGKRKRKRCRIKESSSIHVDNAEMSHTDCESTPRFSRPIETVNYVQLYKIEFSTCVRTGDFSTNGVK